MDALPHCYAPSPGSGASPAADLGYAQRGESNEGGPHAAGESLLFAHDNPILGGCAPSSPGLRWAGQDQNFGHPFLWVTFWVPIKARSLQRCLYIIDIERFKWSGREDSNLRPPGPEPGALPG